MTFILALIKVTLLIPVLRIA